MLAIEGMVRWGDLRGAGDGSVRIGTVYIYLDYKITTLQRLISSLSK